MWIPMFSASLVRLVMELSFVIPQVLLLQVCNARDTDISSMAETLALWESLVQLASSNWHNLAAHLIIIFLSLAFVISSFFFNNRSIGSCLNLGDKLIQANTVAHLLTRNVVSFSNPFV